jgi:hypothetical protein
MSFWSAVVAIVAIIAYTITRVARYRAGLPDPIRHHRPHGPAPSGPSPRELELQSEVKALHDRIAVLERIATDANSESHRKSKAIAEEIESLRDT